MKKLLLTMLSAFILHFAYTQIPLGYYDDASGLTGGDLKSALHNIIDDHTEKSYGDLWDILKESDEDPDNSSNFILIYTGRSISNTSGYPDFNREHVWAKSHGDFGNNPPAGTDAHHIRPSDVSVNSDRGNKDFDNGGTQHSEATGCYWDSDSWEPRDAVKGDVARMMFYMAVRYEGDVSGEPDLELVDYITGSTSSPIFGKLNTLLEWHNEDPVDDFERNRNEVVYSYQNNRNPFIDHPEYVAEIWGGSGNSLPSIVSVNYTPSNPTSTDKVTISATITDADGTISSAKLKWGTSSATYPNEVTMTNSSDIYSGTISSQIEGTTVYFIIEATDNESGINQSSEQSYTIQNISNELPVISNINYSPTNPESTDDVQVSATITDSDGTISMAKVKWGTSTGNYSNELSMSNSGDTYSAEIPAQPDETTVYFIVYVEDNESDSTSSSEYSYTVSDPENQVPVVSNVNLDPQTPTQNDNVIISCAASDSDGSIESVILKWKLESTSYSDVNMNFSGGKYYGQIPKQDVGETVTYSIVAEDEMGSQGTYNDSYQVSQSSNINDINQKSIKAYPNPAKEFLNIETKVDKIDLILLYNVLGEIVLKINDIDNGKYTIGLDKFKTGIYILKVESDDRTHTQKIMIK